MNIENLPLRYKWFLLLCIALIVLSGLTGYGLGFKKGGEVTAKYVFNVATELYNRGFIEVSIDEEFLNAAIFQYNNRVGGCLFINQTEI